MVGVFWSALSGSYFVHHLHMPVTKTVHGQRVIVLAVSAAAAVSAAVDFHPLPDFLLPAHVSVVECTTRIE